MAIAKAAGADMMAADRRCSGDACKPHRHTGFAKLFELGVRTPRGLFLGV